MLQYCVEREREEKGNGNTKTFFILLFKQRAGKPKTSKGKQLDKLTGELAPLLYKQCVQPKNDATSASQLVCQEKPRQKNGRGQKSQRKLQSRWSLEKP